MRVYFLIPLFFLIGGTLGAQPTTWTSRGTGGGGAFYLPSISPHSASDMFVESDMSGVYRSTSSGASWSLTPFLQLQGGGTRGPVQFTSDPNVLYAIDNVNDSGTPKKSTDGGTTWQPLGTDPTQGDAFSLSVDQASVNRVLVSDYTTLFLSTDGGATFSQKFSSNVNGSGCHIAGVWWDGATIIVATNVGLIVSSNGGQTFTPIIIAGIPPDEAMVSFAGGRLGNTARFVCVTLGASDVYAGITGADYARYRGVYVLDAAMTAWTPRTAGIATGMYPFYVAMAKNNPDVMYLAGGSTTGVPVIFTSVNGGQNWSLALQTGNNQNVFTGWAGDGGDFGWSYPEYALGLAVAPTDAQTAVFTDLGCVHVTRDGGAAWHQAYLLPSEEHPPMQATPKGKAYHGIGLENTSCWWLSWSDSTHLFAAFTDVRGMMTTDAGVTWSFGYSGHTQNTMYCVLHDPATLRDYAATSTVHDLYQSTYLQDARIDAGSGKVLWSRDGGQTWLLLHDFGHPVVWIALDPANPNRMYASVVHSTQGGIYTSGDVQNGTSSTWQKLAAPPRTEGHPYAVTVLRDGTLLCSYSGRRAGSPLAFTASSGVFSSTDGGQTWTDRSAPSMQYWTKDVVVDANDTTQNTWYACVFSGWGGPPNGLGGLYKTTNRGQTWTKAFADDRVESCAFRPDNPREMYITTEVDGLWYTADITAANPQFVRVTSYPFRHPMRVFFDPYAPENVWATSFGNGMRSGKAAVIPVELSAFSAACDNANAVLRWSTESESGNTGFEIQRAAFPGDHPPAVNDASQWKTIGFVTGAGSSTMQHEYRFSDTAPAQEANRAYRIRQVDADGSVHVSGSITLQCTSDLRMAIEELRYSASDEHITSLLDVPVSGSYTVTLWSLTGQRMLVRTIDREGAGSMLVSMPARGLPSGTYVMTLDDGIHQTAKSIVISR